MENVIETKHKLCPVCKTRLELVDDFPGVMTHHRCFNESCPLIEVYLLKREKPGVLDSDFGFTLQLN